MSRTTQYRRPQPRNDEFFFNMNPDSWPNSDGPVTALDPPDGGSGGYAIAMVLTRAAPAPESYHDPSRKKIRAWEPRYVTGLVQ